MTTSAPTTVLAHGGGTFTVTSAHAAPQDLAPGTYGISYSPLGGYSITTLTDLQAAPYRVYGRRDATVAKVLRTYRHLDRSLGVLFEGDKGTGKSSTTVELARRARDLFELPVFLVNHATPGLADFLGSLGEAVIVFDEFEKNFPRSGDDDYQAQFLSLFDGTDSTKRLYIVTVNDTTKLSPYLLNRPGRFHYLISFDYPDAQAVREYITNEAPEASSKQIEDVVSFACRARLNYDHLRAVATEITIAGPDEKVSDLVADLNIRDTVGLKFDVAVLLADGTVLEGKNLGIDVFAAEETIWFELPQAKSRVEPHQLAVTFNPAALELDRWTGSFTASDEQVQCVSLNFPYHRGGVDDLEEWERELLKTVDHNDQTISLDDAPAEFDKYAVKRIELVPERNTHDRFAL